MKPHVSSSLVRLGALVSVLLALVSTAHAADPLPEVVARVSPSVVLVTTHDRVGSGFFFAGPSEVVTALSVVRDANSILVQVPGGEPIEAKVTRKDATSGLAILELTSPAEGGQPLALREAPPVVGERVWSIGHASGDDLDESVAQGLGRWALSEGLISELGDQRIQLTLTVPTGAHGAPVFDEDGAVFGVAVSQAGDFGVAADLSALREVSQREPTLHVPVQMTGGVHFRAGLQRTLDRARTGQLGFGVDMGLLIDRRLAITGGVSLTWLASSTERRGPNPQIHGEFFMRVGPSFDLAGKPRGRSGGVALQPFFLAGAMVDRVGSRTWTATQLDPACDPSVGPCTSQQEPTLTWASPPTRMLLGGGLRLLTGPAVYTLDVGTSPTRPGEDFRIGLGVGFQF